MHYNSQAIFVSPFTRFIDPLWRSKAFRCHVKAASWVVAILTGAFVRCGPHWMNVHRRNIWSSQDDVKFENCVVNTYVTGVIRGHNCGHLQLLDWHLVLSHTHSCVQLTSVIDAKSEKITISDAFFILVYELSRLQKDHTTPSIEASKLQNNQNIY